MGTAMTRGDGDGLLRAAALFADQDHGGAGFLDRFGQAVPAEPSLAGAALSGALAARARAGEIRMSLGVGELRLAATTAGATLIACALADPSGTMSVCVRLVDAGCQPIAGACVRVSDGDHEFAVVTDGGGAAALPAAPNSAVGAGLVIRVGARTPTGPGAQPPLDAAGVPREAPAVGRMIELARSSSRDRFELAAAGGEGTGGAAVPEPIEVRGVTFLCRERRRGCDLTLLVAGLSVGSGDSAAGAFGVTFVTRGPDDRRERWIVPLALSPRGLAGSLHSTSARALEEESVDVRGARQLLASLSGELGDGDAFNETVRRSIRHADEGTAWTGLSRRLALGHARELVESTLAETRP